MTSAPDHLLQLSNQPTFRLRDKDEYVAYGENLRTDLGLVDSEGPFEFSAQFVNLDGFGISLAHWGCRASLRGHMSGQVVSFPLRGRALVPGAGRSEHNERAVIVGAHAPDI